MSESKPRKSKRKNQIILRDHVYDGIQEYDQRLPNWWLNTLYGAIVFSVFYWFILYQADDGSFQEDQLNARLSEIQAARLAALDAFDDSTLWQMSLNGPVIEEGRAIYERNCQVCHLASLRGKDEPGGIGENLLDETWKYGGDPTSVMQIVLKGSPDTTAGMQAWESTLGTQGSAQVTAFILSHHQQP